MLLSGDFDTGAETTAKKLVAAALSKKSVTLDANLLSKFNFLARTEAGADVLMSVLMHAADTYGSHPDPIFKILTILDSCMNCAGRAMIEVLKKNLYLIETLDLLTFEKVVEPRRQAVHDAVHNMVIRIKSSSEDQILQRSQSCESAPLFADFSDSLQADQSDCSNSSYAEIVQNEIFDFDSDHDDVVVAEEQEADPFEDFIGYDPFVSFVPPPFTLWQDA